MRDCGACYGAVVATPIDINLDFKGSGPIIWDNQLIPATPAFVGDIPAVVALVARNFAPFNVVVSASDAPGVQGQSVRVIVGGDGAWFSPVATGVTNLFEIYEPTPTAFAFSLRLNNDVRFVAFSIIHELCHALAGLNHQSLWESVAGVATRKAEYRDGWFMGNPYTPAEPIFGRGTDSAGQPQDDVAQLGAAVGFAVPEPIWGTVAALGGYLLTMRRHNRQSQLRPASLGTSTTESMEAKANQRRALLSAALGSEALTATSTGCSPKKSSRLPVTLYRMGSAYSNAKTGAQPCP